MSQVEAFRVPMDVDLRGFTTLLRALGIAHRVVESNDAQIVWVLDVDSAEEVRALYAKHPNGAEPENVEVSERMQARLARRRSVKEQLTRSPATTAMLMLTLLAALFTGFGDQFSTIRWLSFLDFRIQDQYLYFAPIEHTLTSQWWRLVTPMFIHFGFLHLAMNSLWYWELGKRIETRHGALALVGLSLVFSVIANVAQYTYGGPSLFGGLSGVLYGLLGYCWIFQKVSPNSIFRLPPGVVGMMLIWLVVCMTGVVGALGFGAIANAAHVGGLVAGCGLGAIAGVLSRGRGQRV